jgi:hypothetical protein
MSNFRAQAAQSAQTQAAQVMTNSLESSTSSTSQPVPAQSSGWVKLGVIAAASALAGGLAAA